MKKIICLCVTFCIFFSSVIVIGDEWSSNIIPGGDFESTQVSSIFSFTDAVGSATHICREYIDSEHGYALQLLPSENTKSPSMTLNLTDYFNNFHKTGKKIRISFKIKAGQDNINALRLEVRTNRVIPKAKSHAEFGVTEDFNDTYRFNSDELKVENGWLNFEDEFDFSCVPYGQTGEMLKNLPGGSSSNQWWLYFVPQFSTSTSTEDAIYIDDLAIEYSPKDQLNTENLIEDAHCNTDTSIAVTFASVDNDTNHTIGGGSSIKLIPQGTPATMAWTRLIKFTPTDMLISGQKYYFSFWYKHIIPETKTKPFNGAIYLRYMQKTLNYAIGINGSETSTSCFLTNENYQTGSDATPYRVSTQMLSETDRWEKAEIYFVATDDMVTNLKDMYISIVPVERDDKYDGDYKIWIDDLNLRAVPDKIVKLIDTVPHGIVPLSKTDRINFLFDGNVDAFSIIPENICVNEKIQNGESVSVNIIDQTSFYINKSTSLAPGYLYKFEIKGVKDVYGRDIADVDAQFSVLNRAQAKYSFLSNAEMVNDINLADTIQFLVTNNNGENTEFFVTVFEYENTHITNMVISNKVNIEDEATMTVSVNISCFNKDARIKGYIWSKNGNKTQAMTEEILIN